MVFESLDSGSLPNPVLTPPREPGNQASLRVYRIALTGTPMNQATVIT
jgi:hypothetical protein